MVSKLFFIKHDISISSEIKFLTGRPSTIGASGDRLRRVRLILTSSLRAYIYIYTSYECYTCRQANRLHYKSLLFLKKRWIYAYISARVCAFGHKPIVFPPDPEGHEFTIRGTHSRFSVISFRGGTMCNITRSTYVVYAHDPPTQ